MGQGRMRVCPSEVERCAEARGSGGGDSGRHD